MEGEMEGLWDGFCMQIRHSLLLAFLVAHSEGRYATSFGVTASVRKL